MSDATLELHDDLLGRRLVAAWLPVLNRTNAYDAKWPWPRKSLPENLCHSNGIEHVAIVHDGDVQGTLVTSVPIARPALSLVESLIYVEWLATAPWNRSDAEGGRRFKGIGVVLLRHAVLRSRSLGCDGRIGLHSEAGAIAFYDRLSLRKAGRDPNEEDRVYFEGDSAWAVKFLGGT